MREFYCWRNELREHNAKKPNYFQAKIFEQIRKEAQKESEKKNKYQMMLLNAEMGS